MITHRYHFLGGVMAHHIREVKHHTLHDPLNGVVGFAPTQDQIDQYMAYRAEMKPGDREPEPPQGAEYRIAYSECRTIEPTPHCPATHLATYYMIPNYVVPGEEMRFFSEHVRIIYGQIANLRHKLNEQ